MFARKDALRRHEKMNASGKKTHCVSRPEDEAPPKPRPDITKIDPSEFASVEDLDKQRELLEELRNHIMRLDASNAAHNFSV